MSEENVEIVLQAVAAFIEGEYERLIELSDPQIEYDVSRTSPESRVVRGREEVLAVLEEWVDTWDEHQVELVELIDAGGERVVAVIYERGKLKGSDAWVSTLAASSTPSAISGSSDTKNTKTAHRPSKPSGCRSRRCRGSTPTPSRRSRPSPTRTPSPCRRFRLFPERGCTRPDSACDTTSSLSRGILSGRCPSRT